MYDQKFLLVPNSIHRYSLGSHTRSLRRNADGPLDIYVQRLAPAARCWGCSAAGAVPRRNSRCSTIRRESQITSPSMTTIGTRCCPLSASTSGRSERRCGTTTDSKATASRRSARATFPQGQSQSVGVLQR